VRSIDSPEQLPVETLLSRTALRKYATGEISDTLTMQTWQETLILDEFGNNSFSIIFESNLPANPFFVFMDRYGFQRRYYNVEIYRNILVVHDLTLKKLFENHDPSLYMAVLDITNRHALWNCSFQFN
jgi:hypothetical protein